MLEVEPFVKSEVLSTVEQVFIGDIFAPFGPNSSIMVLSDQRILFLTVRGSFRCFFFANSKQAFESFAVKRGFRLATLP